MMKSLVYLIAATLLAASTFAASSQSTHPPVRRHAPAPPPDADRGERAYQANCSRCHYAPDSLKPRITGTIVRHMRVRANLSAADERDILRYLNP